MTQDSDLRQFVPHAADLRPMLRLALPVVLVQLGMMTMGAADTIMVGHVSAGDLAAVALGNLYFFAVAVFGMGTLMALDPLVAQAVGAGDAPAVARAVQRGLLLAAALSVPSSAALAPAGPVFALLHQPAEVIPIAAGYAAASIPGVLPFLAFVVLRQSLQAMHRMAPIVITILAANLLNVLLNWVLIFGHLGLPPLGAVGSAWASSISRWGMALGLLAVGWRELRPVVLPPRPDALRLGPIGRMLRLGAPIGAQMQLEFGAFGVIGLMMGWMGTREMAGHQIALNLASLTFMVPLGVSAAAAVLVGNAVGRGDEPGARRAAGAAIASGVGVMAVSAVVFLLVPGRLAALYTDQVAVAAIASALLPIAGLFQVFDGVQVVSIGVLRGVGDTRTPMVLNVLGFWILGVPVSTYLGFRAGRGPEGLWWGLVLGLAVVATTLLARVAWRLSGALHRLILDHELPPPLAPGTADAGGGPVPPAHLS